MNASQEAVFYNALNLATEANYQLLLKLKQRFGSFESAWEQAHRAPLEGLAHQETLERFLKKKNDIHAEREYERLDTHHAVLIMNGDERYPSRLTEIPYPPHGLYVRGALALNRPIAIVGTRAATEYGIRASQHLVEGLVKYGATIISGLALGIDEVAHRACVERHGHTLAVIGSGIERTYPEKNTQLAEKIVAGGGAIVTEYPLATPPLQHHFPARNRIVSGLSMGVAVVEAPKKSGSLITAYFALDHNRDIFVVPGSIFSSYMEGSHQLLKRGAKITVSADDIAEEYGWQKQPEPEKVSFAGTPEEEAIVRALAESAAPLAVDEVRVQTKLDILAVNQKLSMLLLMGIIKETNGKYYL